ncbi:MAG: HAD-IIB family hydrolase, partial [Cutibacterium granulosum]|nr:HAD-IIB family hydrolase [Cutibacterium granulosum]
MTHAIDHPSHNPDTPDNPHRCDDLRRLRPEVNPLAPNIRLVVTDMDGTLLRPNHHLPEGLEPILQAMARRNIVFAPASGRQCAALTAQFPAVPGHSLIIAENGTNVVMDGELIYSSPLDPQVVRRTIIRVRELRAAGIDCAAVVCHPECGYVERDDEPFLREVTPYYLSHEVTTDLLDTHNGAVCEGAVKVAIHCFDDAETVLAPRMADFAELCQVTVSGQHWIDMSNVGTNKGSALSQVQGRLGISRDETVVFGDYLNDLAMMDCATMSFAMANAHPQVIDKAAYLAP